MTDPKEARRQFRMALDEAFRPYDIYGFGLIVVDAERIKLWYNFLQGGVYDMP